MISKEIYRRPRFLPCPTVFWFWATDFEGISLDLARRRLVGHDVASRFENKQDCNKRAKLFELRREEGASGRGVRLMEIRRLNSNRPDRPTDRPTECPRSAVIGFRTASSSTRKWIQRISLSLPPHLPPSTARSRLSRLACFLIPTAQRTLHLAVDPCFVTFRERQSEKGEFEWVEESLPHLAFETRFPPLLPFWYVMHYDYVTIDRLIHSTLGRTINFLVTSNMESR